MADKRKIVFIETVEYLFRNADPLDIPSDAVLFFEDYKKAKSGNTKKFTEKGIAVLKAMREVDDWITAKSLGERIDVSGRSVSGTMKKLISDRYVEKREGNPTSYRITKLGKTCDLNIDIEES